MGLSDELIQASLLGEAVDHGPALVFVADETMRYAAVNARACELLGYKRSELVGMEVTDVARYDEAAAEYGEMKDERGRADVAVLTRKDGTTFRFRYIAGETTVAGMPYYVSVGWPEPE